MRNQEKKPKESYEELFSAISPIIFQAGTLSNSLSHLNAMFIGAMANADQNEVDNYSAKCIGPTFWALSQTLLNLQEIDKIRKLQKKELIP